MKSKNEKLPKAVQDNRRRHWVYNDEKILKAYKEMLDAGLHPSYRLIAKKTGLNLKTVEKHINDWKFDEFIKPYRYYSPLVLNCLVQKIREYGDAPRVKLFNQLVNGYRDSHEITGKDGEPLVTSVKIEVNNGTETKDD